MGINLFISQTNWRWKAKMVRTFPWNWVSIKLASSANYSISNFLLHTQKNPISENQLPFLGWKYISENSKVDFEYDYLFMKALNKTLYR